MDEQCQIVLDYISSKCQDTLVFCDEDGKDGYSIDKEFNTMPSFEDTIYTCLRYTLRYWSKNKETNKLETNNGRWRSSLDIWRHVKQYYPECTIFDVMRGLYRIESELGGNYCKDIYRRTFKINPNRLFNMMDRPDRDEYGLLWQDWEHIGEELK